LEEFELCLGLDLN